MYKTIIFDLGGVLFTNGTKKFIEDLSQKHSLNPSDVKDLMEGEWGTLYREGKISNSEFWNKVIVQLNLTNTQDELENQWIDSYQLISGTADIIHKLAKNYQIYYLSDNVKERVDKINQKYNFLSWFHGGVFSHEVGIRKPNPKIYELVLKNSETSPHQAIFIDDKPEFVKPAQELGITGIVFENPTQLQTSLAQLQIKF